MASSLETISLRARVHLVLAHDPGAESVWNRRIHALLSVLIIANVAAVLGEMSGAIRQDVLDFVHLFDVASVTVFTVEYLLRLWSAVEDPRYSGGFRGRIAYAASPLMVADLFAISHFYLPFLVVVDLRLLRLLRLMHMVRLYAENGGRTHG